MNEAEALTLEQEVANMPPDVVQELLEEMRALRKELGQVREELGGIRALSNELNRRANNHGTRIRDLEVHSGANTSQIREARDSVDRAFRRIKTIEERERGELLEERRILRKERVKAAGWTTVALGATLAAAKAIWEFLQGG